ncbi:hypothetical protein CAPN001_15670 [Capnocytophaga stomatis]|nr:hypothetical protein CAPN002_24900 [Capnocytophaga stomatis]GIJ96998.1 hypothetical protein CAPN001_15670 [Capnocytophaga stomatis]GIM50519.1 hypothetical protein CAPN003_19710 [Capnocytophaga stomatis]
MVSGLITSPREAAKIDSGEANPIEILSNFETVVFLSLAILYGCKNFYFIVKPSKVLKTFYFRGFIERILDF